MWCSEVTDSGIKEGCHTANEREVKSYLMYEGILYWHVDYRGAAHRQRTSLQDQDQQQ